MTDPTWTVDDDGDLFRGDPEAPTDYIVRGAGSTGTNITPEGHADLVQCVSEAALLPAALDVTAGYHEFYRAHTVMEHGIADFRLHRAAVDRLEAATKALNTFHWPDAERAALDRAKDRQP